MRYSIFALLVVTTLGRADDWPQWLGPMRDGIWREDGILDKFPDGGPKLRWRAKIGAGYAGPAVAGDRVYVADRVLKPGTANPSNPFDQKTVVPGFERVICLSDADGRELWSREWPCDYRISYQSGPRATPLIADQKLYFLGAMGDFRCLNATTGATIWEHNFVNEFKAPIPIWGWSGHPLIDGDRIFAMVGGDGSIVVAFNKDTGKEIWRNLTAYSIGYAPPTMIELGGSRQLIIWDAEAVHGLDPATGKELWSVPFRMKEPAALSVPTPRLDRDRLFLTSFYDSAIMLKLDDSKPAATVMWKGNSKSERADKTDTLHSIMPTPFIQKGLIFGICSYGQLRCLEADSGKRVWESMAATRKKVDGKIQPTNPSPQGNERWANAFLTPHKDRFFLFNEHGDLIIARLTMNGYEELDRARVIEADDPMPGRKVVWSHPAYAHQSAYIRNGQEIICISLKSSP